jgi:hypothetical protein
VLAHGSDIAVAYRHSRSPAPRHPAGLAVAPPMAQQLTAAFGQNAPGAFTFTQYSSEADARAAIDSRDVVAALIARPF